MKYKTINNQDLIFYRPDNTTGTVTFQNIQNGIKEFNRIMDVFHQVNIPISEILGLRNLSAFVGEVLNQAIATTSGNYIIKNPHQDGYPDLLIMDQIGHKLYNKYKNQLHEKGPFSPFVAGGIEVKATCGDLRSGTWFTKHKIIKPIIGQERLRYVTGYNWKAHHQNTNNLLGIVWDFVDTKPSIIALFYSNELDITDWGKTVLPKPGSRTTSVSIMNKSGIDKMRSGLRLVIDDDNYLSDFKLY